MVVLPGDYTFWTDAVMCYAYNTGKKAIEYSGPDASTVIQAALDATGRGRFEFKSGEFVLSTPLRPGSHQAWILASGAEFKPEGDNGILSIQNVEQFNMEGTLRCVDPATDVSAYALADGRAETDLTEQANDDEANDCLLLPDSPQAGDCGKVGYTTRFNCVKLNIATPGAGDYAVVFEYWDETASTWMALTDVRDDSRSESASPFSKSGTGYVFFKDVPATWGAIDGQYWIRWRVTEVVSCTTAPVATRLSVHRTSTAAAIVVDDLEFSHAQSIWIRDYFDAIRFAGTDGTRENDFDTIYGQVRNDGLTFASQCHDNHFKQVFIKGPSPYACGHSTGNGFYMACTGTKGGNSVDELQLIDMGKGVNLPGASEVWFGTVLVDNPKDEGITILGDCERLFFDTVWASSGGDGLVVCGDPENPLADGVFINQLYCWLNAGHGVHIKSHVSRIHLGCVSVTRNGTGFRIEGPDASGINVPRLESWNNTAQDLDCAGAAGGVEFGSLTLSAVTTLAGIG